MNEKNEKIGYFRHHKGQIYFALGTAKHSETLEDYIVYETRYNNPLSKLWIRPKKMFEESIIKDGLSIERFTPLQWTIVEKSIPTDHDINEIIQISELVFGKSYPDKLKSELNASTRWLFLFVKTPDNKTVGFKYGKAKNSSEFFSANGAVLPEFRNLGIGSLLMKTQHDWVKKNGFQRIDTKTRNHFPDMLRLNLKFGYQIIGCTTEGGKPKIHLSKSFK